MEFLDKYVIPNFYAIWMGIALAVVGFDIGSWQYYFVCLPTIAAVVLFYKVKP